MILKNKISYKHFLEFRHHLSSVSHCQPYSRLAWIRFLIVVLSTVALKCLSF